MRGDDAANTDYNVNDVAPTSGATRFPAYFAPDTPSFANLSDYRFLSERYLERHLHCLKLEPRRTKLPDCQRHSKDLTRALQVYCAASKIRHKYLNR